MSTFALVQRGVISITSADGAGPKKATLGTTIKPGSSFVITSVRDKRRRYAVQRGIISAANPDTSPKDATISAVVMANSEVKATVRYNRTGPERSATVHLQATTTVRLEWDGTIAVSETIDARFEVVEHREQIGATIRLINEASVDKVEVSWDGTLLTGETIDVFFEVFDLENFGDDIKEILFRLEGVLGYLGENLIQDLIVHDPAGNLVQFRMRLFDSKANLDLATKDIVLGSPLQAGETRRALVTQTIVKRKNVRGGLEKTLDLVLSPTPGVD